jgi:hypothetical protein
LLLLGEVQKKESKWKKEEVMGKTSLERIDWRKQRNLLIIKNKNESG